MVNGKQYNKRMYLAGQKRSRRLAALRKKGLTVRELAEIEGTSGSRIRYLLGRLDVE